jgi:hypothetical protein
MSVVLFDGVIEAYIENPAGPVALQIAEKAKVGVEAAQAEVRKIMHRMPDNENVAQNVRFEMEGPVARLGIDISRSLGPRPKQGKKDRGPELYLDKKAKNEGSWLRVAYEAIQATRV